MPGIYILMTEASRFKTDSRILFSGSNLLLVSSQAKKKKKKTKKKKKAPFLFQKKMPWKMS